MLSGWKSPNNHPNGPKASAELHLKHLSEIASDLDANKGFKQPSAPLKDCSTNDANLRLEVEDQSVKMNIKPKFYFEPNGVPVFQPTVSEFKDFYKFVLSIEKYGMDAGLVKIIPPKEWFQSFDLNLEMLKEFKIKPIKQKFNCGSGLPLGAYRQVNMGSAKEYTVEEWATLSKDDYRVPTLTRGGVEVKPEEVVIPRQSVHELPSAWSDSYLTEFNVRNTHTYWNALEKHYWNNLTFNSALYGADLMGSLFVDKAENKWNIAKLESILSKIGTKVPGVTTPYLYFGTYKSTFAWHVEDMDLSSINYIHFGAPKQWYVVPPVAKKSFEKLAKCKVN